MAYIPESNSVVAFQSDPTKLVGTVSVIGTLSPSSVMVLNPVSTLAVTGNLGSSVIGHAPVVIVGGSILTSATANQSVSGTVQTDVRSSVAAVIIGGSIAASFTPPDNQSVSGTVDVSQIGTWRVSVVSSTPSSLLAGVSVIGLTPVNVTNFPTSQNVSGSVAAWLQSTDASIITVGGATGNSSVQVLNFPANQSVSGAVQIAGVDPASIVSVRLIDDDLASSAIALVTQGLIYGKTTAGGGAYVEVKVNPSGGLEVGANQEGTWRVSVISSTPSSLLAGVSIIGLPPVNVTNTNLNVSGSVAAWLQSTNASIITVGGAAGNSSVQVLNFPTNQSVSGTVGTTQQGTWISSIVNTVPSSVIVGASIFGLPPVNVTNTNLNVGGSVVAFQGAGWSGSVAAFKAGTWVTSLVSTVPSSVIVGASIFGLPPVNVTNTNLNVGGSVVTFQGGTQITSISGSLSASIAGTVPVTQSSGWRVSVQTAVSPTATISSMKAIASTTTLLAANAERRGAMISNVSGTSILVKFGNMATVNNNSFMMNNGDYYETPYNYSGIIQHFASSTAGFIQVTEIT